MHRLQDPFLTISEPQNWQRGASPKLCDLPQAFDYTAQLDRGCLKTSFQEMTVPGVRRYAKPILG
jgi:hypothetical protein